MSEQDVEKAVLAFVDDYLRPHWNVEIPLAWHGTRSVTGVGSYIGDYVKAREGVYRLIAMADMTTRKPMVLNRIGGRDETGTLYIGCGSSVRLRLQQLVRSLREPRKKRNLGEHSVGGSIRANPILRKLFPRECLAVAWAYTAHPERYEKNLLGHYVRCFGEPPPLNIIAHGHDWFDPPAENETQSG